MSTAVVYIGRKLYGLRDEEGLRDCRMGGSRDAGLSKCGIFKMRD